MLYTWLFSQQKERAEGSSCACLRFAGGKDRAAKAHEEQFRQRLLGRSALEEKVEQMKRQKRRLKVEER